MYDKPYAIPQVKICASTHFNPVLERAIEEPGIKNVDLAAGKIRLSMTEFKIKEENVDIVY